MLRVRARIVLLILKLADHHLVAATFTRCRASMRFSSLCWRRSRIWTGVSLERVGMVRSVAFLRLFFAMGPGRQGF